MAAYMISLKPAYATYILLDVKRFEVRTRIPKLRIGDEIFFYTTKPVGKVEGKFIVADIFEGNPMDLWNRYGRLTCIKRDDYLRYVEGHTKVYFIQIGDVFTKTLRLPLSDYGLKRAPQWFIKIWLNG